MSEVLETVKVKSTIQDIPIEWLYRGSYQPRENFDLEALKQLGETIKLNGVLSPLLVRAGAERNSYEIIAGERRWRASQLAGLNTVPCILLNCPDEQVAQIALIENIAREDLNPIEEANAIQRLIDEFDYTHEVAAKTLGKSRTEITNSLRLLKLDEKVKDFIIKGFLSGSHAKLLAGVSISSQRKLAIVCVEKNWSSRQLENAIKSEKQLKPKSINNSKEASIKHLERQLSDYLGTSVQFDLDSPQKGVLSIRFQSLEILDGLLEKMGCRNEE